VVAVGGYGRRELCPASDVDLLVLHDGCDAAVLERVVRGVVYPLWDAGLTVGYAVRSRREALRATDVLDDATAALDARPVAGDASLAVDLRTEVARGLRRRPQPFLARLAAADAQRRSAAADATEAIEPDLKLGAGGLRDLQSLRWLGATIVGVAGLDGLVPGGLMAAADLPRLRAAAERLLAVRVVLHLVAAERAGVAAAPARLPARGDVVRLELQEAVAHRLGHVDLGPHELAPHRLLRDLALDARSIAHAHARAWALVRADLARGSRRRARPTERILGGLEVADGVVRLPPEADLDVPDLPVRVLDALVATGGVLDRRTAGRLRERTAGGDLAWDLAADGGAAVRRALWAGPTGLPALFELDDVGIVSALLPEWEPVRGRTQRNPYHRFTADRHGWHAAAELADLVRREPWAAETLERVADRDALILAALLHDVGKGYGEPHAETGVAPAVALAGRLGASPATRGTVARLVRLHLLLPDTARRRDLADPAVAEEVAAAVGDPPTLAALHLLAAADGRATGPTAWSAWTAALVDTLVRRVAAVLEAAAPDVLGDEAAATARAAQRLAPELGCDPAVVRSHLALLPSRYAAAVTPRAVVRHALMAATPPDPGTFLTRVTPGSDDGVDELDVVASDAPGRFARVAGVLALHGGSVLAADAFARSDGLLVDTFRVQRPDGATGSWWVRVEGDLADAAEGRLAVRARIARKARAESDRVARLPAVATELRTGPDPSGAGTLVEIRTQDRLGVLHAIADAIAELRLDIVYARIQTLGHEVIDAFTLRDRTGAPLDADQCGELELAVRWALETLGAAPAGGASAA
jgi:[protein-PII] uridylyltransferase